MLGHHSPRGVLRAALGRGLPGPRSRRRRAALGAAVAVASAAAAGSAAPALAAGTSTITAAVTTTTPEQAVPVDLTFSGTNGSSGSAEVVAVVRPAGGLACQSSYQEDESTLGGVDSTLLAPGPPTITTGGPYQVTANFRPTSPGSYQVCAWLDSGTTGSSPLAAPATVSLTAQGPQVSQFTLTVPKALAPNTPFDIGWTTQTDQPLSLYAILKTAPPSTVTVAPCASSYEAERAAHGDEFPITNIDPASVFGGPMTTSATLTRPTSNYVLCSWLEGPSYGQVDRALATPITVGTPTPPSPPKPGLKLGRVNASRRHGLSVAGSTGSGFSGRVTVVAACGRSTARRVATARNRRFTTRLGLPGGCRRARRVKVTVSWAGSTAFARQSVTRTVGIGR